MNSYIHIGKIVATFGVGGEVVLKHSLSKKSNFKNTTVLFIELVKGNKIPYFITQAKAKNTEESFILLEGINSKEAAHKLIGKPAWLTEEDFRKQAGKQAPIGLLGYTVIEDNTILGTVLEVIEQPHQVLLSINYNNNNAFIPLHSETLKKINHSKKEVFVTLPDGLLDIYTG
jgi:16S rRNA processing protein RimM